MTSKNHLAPLLCISYLGFPGGLAGKESACNEGDLGSIPGLGRSLGLRDFLFSWPSIDLGTEFLVFNLEYILGWKCLECFLFPALNHDRHSSKSFVMQSNP